LEPEIIDDPLLDDCVDITVLYKFYPAVNQDLARWVEDQNNWEYEQKKYIRQKRIDKGMEKGEDVKELLNENAVELALYESRAEHIKSNKVELLKME